MAEPMTGPLGEADLDALKDRLQQLDQAQRIIDQAIRGGIDMSGQQTKLRELREQLTKMKNSFFPGR